MAIRASCNGANSRVMRDYLRAMTRAVARLNIERNTSRSLEQQLQLQREIVRATEAFYKPNSTKHAQAVRSLVELLKRHEMFEEACQRMEQLDGQFTDVDDLCLWVDLLDGLSRQGGDARERARRVCASFTPAVAELKGRGRPDPSLGAAEESLALLQAILGETSAQIHHLQSASLVWWELNMVSRAISVTSWLCEELIRDGRLEEADDACESLIQLLESFQPCSLEPAEYGAAVMRVAHAFNRVGKNDRVHRLYRAAICAASAENPSAVRAFQSLSDGVEPP